jgi:glycolate oxidase FAD binding subunit
LADAGATKIRSAVTAAGGHATLIRGSEVVRATVDVFQPFDPVVMKLTKGLKDVFDPKGLLNPGRMYAEV